MNTSKRDLTRIRHNTKIVATLGPGSNNVQLLEDMIRVGGLNVVRFNFSHGTAEFHQENARIVREAAKRAGQEIAILADLQGPKIRVVWITATCRKTCKAVMFCGWMTAC